MRGRASRSDWDFMVKVVAEVVRAGAGIINLPDTTGHAILEEYEQLFRYMREHVPNSEHVIWSAHCHNDLGLGVANSLAAIRGGARQIECTINGIGERAGNCSLEEVVMALKTRKDFMHVQSRVETRQIYPASRLLAQVIGWPVPPNKPIVGDNAFAHEAGIHQDGVLKYKLTYEIMKPEDIGIPSNKLVLASIPGVMRSPIDSPNWASTSRLSISRRPSRNLRISATRRRRLSTTTTSLRW